MSVLLKNKNNLMKNEYLYIEHLSFKCLMSVKVFISETLRRFRRLCS